MVHGTDLHYNWSTNSTQFSFVCLNHESWGRAVTSVAGAMILIGNLLVVLVILKYPARRRFRPLNWFIMQLAIADFSVGLIVLWIGTFSALLLDTVSLISSIMTYGALASATSTSTLGILYIALDRYFYIVQHTNYKRIVTRRKVAIAIAAACLLPFCVFIVGPALGWNCIKTCYCQLYNKDPTQRYCFGDYCSQMMTPFRSETVLIGGISLVLLLIVSIAIYLQIFFKVRFKFPSTMQRKRRTSEMRMIKTMLIVLSGFVFTTGPLAICCIISFFHNQRELHFIMRILVVISTVNSILNPLFYFWRIPEMNSNLRILVRECVRFCFSCFHEQRFNTTQKKRKLSNTKLYKTSNIVDEIAYYDKSNVIYKPTNFKA